MGLLESVTARESADIDSPGGARRETVEPLTNYMVGRVSQDLRGGHTVVGGMLTSVMRDIADPQLGFLERRAWAGGVDLQHYFRDRDYRLEVRVLGSHLRGSEEAILDAQTASARYFQRPDNDHAHVDPTRTTLSGHAGSAMLTRTGNNTNLMYQVGGAWRSPGFEINDLGYMRVADEINQFGWVGYFRRNPFWIFNSLQVNANEWSDWDFGGSPLQKAVNLNTNGQFRSQERFYLSATRTFAGVSNTALRGGPSSRWPGGWELQASLNSDERRKLQANGGVWSWRRDEDSQDTWNVWTELVAQAGQQPAPVVQSSYEHNVDQVQYVQTSSTGRRQPLTSSATWTSAPLRSRSALDLCLTPKLTMQYYGSPFVSAGSYSRFKRTADPRAARYADRFHTFGESEITAVDGGYEVDEDGDSAADYTIANPDFNVREFNSNLVLRWEYDPGSTLYVVWSQGRTDVIDNGRFSLRDDLDGLFGTHPRNVFLVKFNKWFSL